MHQLCYCRGEKWTQTVVFKKITPYIIGRDKISTTTAVPFNIISILLNFKSILTSPNVVIVELSVAQFADFNHKELNLLSSPLDDCKKVSQKWQYL